MKINRSGVARLSLCMVLLVTACSSDDDNDSAQVDNGDISDDGFTTESVVLGDRPSALVALLPEGDLKTRLETCDVSAVRPQAFSIAHRGAPFEYPEHSVEGYEAAATQGAGVIECDVTFTSDRELICRHSQCDLHTTTDILATDLAQKCSVPPDMNSAIPYQDVQCCTSDLTLTEFRTLMAECLCSPFSWKTYRTGFQRRHRSASRPYTSTAATL